MLADSFVALGMKNKQISLGMWKNHIVHFNGKQGKVVDWIDGTDRFLVEFKKSNFKWIDKRLIVWK